MWKLFVVFILTTLTVFANCCDLCFKFTGQIAYCTHSAKCVKVLNADKRLREVRVRNCNVTVTLSRDLIKNVIDITDRTGKRCYETTLRTQRTTDLQQASWQPTTDLGQASCQPTTKAPKEIAETTKQTVSAKFIKRFLESLKTEDDDESIMEKTWGLLTWLLATTFTVVLLVIKKWLAKKCNQLLEINSVNNNDVETPPQDDDVELETPPQDDDVELETPPHDEPPTPLNESQIPLLHRPPSEAITTSNDDADEEKYIAPRTRSQTRVVNL